MITLNSFSESIVNLIKPAITKGWKLVADLGELVENKDLAAYFTVSKSTSVIYGNTTMRLDCELVGTLLFEERTNKEVDELTNDLYQAIYTTLKSLPKYTELECGAIYLDCDPQLPETDTDDYYYSFRMPLVIHAQF